jgi:hypothetical protein
MEAVMIKCVGRFVSKWFVIILPLVASALIALVAGWKYLQSLA